ncbi:MAG TPA: Maf family nucleotide pyrophosphatase [Burkholderiales bacterium]|jgi:septum formation protein|nr:Maf family nucleotide pyrophosphatase [Burkholderiales bacterium]
MSSTNSGLQLILASTSRYRKELLSRLGLAFETTAPEVDETALNGEQPTDTAFRLALAKAQAVRARFPGALIIGSDQVAVCDGARLDKPMTHAVAVQQLRHVSGRSVTFHSAVVLLNARSGRTQSRLVPTTVKFRRLDDAEIERYLRREPAYDCAGSAKAEGLGISLVESIESGDPTALIGLPLIALSSMLREEHLIIP